VAEARKDPGLWLPAARAGSREALGELLEACRRYLLRIAQQELDPELQAKGGASDLVQETFLEAQRDFPRFQGNTEAELLAWLRQLLRFHLSKFQRQYRGTKKRQVRREVALDAAELSLERAGGPGAGTPTPSDEAIQHEEDQALQQALTRLPDDYRRVILLRHQEERSLEEIGQIMQRSAEAVRKLWARAVERLQEEIEKGPNDTLP
jgi:RNA polymerase sigma-70 factor (ECF subfamily)